MTPKRKNQLVLGGIMIAAAVLYGMHPALGAIAVGAAAWFAYAKSL